MTPARKSATSYVVELLSTFAGKNRSVTEIEEMLNALTDKEFDSYMAALRDGDETLPYIAPNLKDVGLSLERNLEIAGKLGHEFFQRLWLTDQATGNTYLTPVKYLVVDLPLRRQQQHLHKKISIPADNAHVDELTGQPTGESKGSKISFPELQILYSQGLNEPIRELLKFRGGDSKAYRSLTRQALVQGIPSMDLSEDPTSRPRSTETLSTLLKAAHLDNNL